MQKPIKLDKIDRRILETLQLNNQISNIKLAEIACISPPSCLRRVRRLRNNGVIVGDVSLVDPKALGRPTTIIVEVILESERIDLVDEFRRQMLSLPEVSQCYAVAGESDFIVILNVNDVVEYQNFIDRVFYANKNIRKFRSIVSIECFKFQTRIPISVG